MQGIVLITGFDTQPLIVRITSFDIIYFKDLGIPGSVIRLPRRRVKSAQ